MVTLFFYPSDLKSTQLSFILSNEHKTRSTMQWEKREPKEE